MLFSGSFLVKEHDFFLHTIIFPVMYRYIQRKRRDSNSRNSCPFVSLANWWFQPLTHTSFQGIFSQMRCKYRLNFCTMQIFGKDFLCQNLTFPVSNSTSIYNTWKMSAVPLTVRRVVFVCEFLLSDSGILTYINCPVRRNG